MPNDTYTVTLTKKELWYILETLDSDQKDLYYHGASYDFLDKLIDKLDAIYEED